MLSLPTTPSRWLTNSRRLRATVSVGTKTETTGTCYHPHSDARSICYRFSLHRVNTYTNKLKNHLIYKQNRKSYFHLRTSTQKYFPENQTHNLETNWGNCMYPLTSTYMYIHPEIFSRPIEGAVSTCKHPPTLSTNKLPRNHTCNLETNLTEHNYMQCVYVPVPINVHLRRCTSHLEIFSQDQICNLDQKNGRNVPTLPHYKYVQDFPMIYRLPTFTHATTCNVTLEACSMRKYIYPPYCIFIHTWTHLRKCTNVQILTFLLMSQTTRGWYNTVYMDRQLSINRILTFYLPKLVCFRIRMYAYLHWSYIYNMYIRTYTQSIPSLTIKLYKL